MKHNLKNRKKGIAILLALFLLVFLVVFAEVVWSYYISTILLQRRYENTLQNIYNLEAAKTACMWEVNHAATGWNTVTAGTVCQLQGAAISWGTDGGAGGGRNYYRLAGFNFRAQVIYAGGNTTIYTHAFRGTETNPQYSNYLEFIPVPSVTPLYQFVLFENGDLILPIEGYDNILRCNGGRIHANGDVQFGRYYVELRLDQIMQLSAAGTIKYRGDTAPYPAPRDIDNLDGGIDGMAPAPYVNTPLAPGNHHYTTDGAGVNKALESYSYPASYLADRWWYPVPYLMQGEDSWFDGRQYQDAIDPTLNHHLAKDGESYETYYVPEGSEPAVIHRFYLSDLSGTSLTSSVMTENGWDYQDVYFKPYQDSEGELNDEWFEIPGGLPQSYTYEKYYKYYGEESGYYTNQQPVTLYATQRCTSGTAGCTQNWRYIKTLGGTTCTDNTCYNDAGSQYVKAQDYITSDGKPYYDTSHINPEPESTNNEFFDNNDYIYGDDWNDPNSPYRQIRAFDILQQPEGFQAYLSLLQQAGLPEDIIEAGVERKEMSLGALFDETDSEGNVTTHSTYKNKAINGGLYIDCDNADDVIDDLNSGGVEVAKKVTFYNWYTNSPITVVDIDVGLMTQQNKNPGNGIVYAKCIPVRLSNAENLPGTNNGDTRAVFTVISEESLYLKGDYNYDPDSSAEENESQRKLSNIATKKRVYTLSNAFNAETSPDWAVYKDYRYVYVKKVNGQFVQEEGDPALGNGAWRTYYDSDNSALDTWVENTVIQKQTDYENSGINPPNRVDKDEYRYYSLFITPYEINDSLENWYQAPGGYGYEAKKYIIGSVLNLYADDPGHPEYQNYKSNLGPEEDDFDCRDRLAPECYFAAVSGAGLDTGWSSPSPWRFLEYDKIFPQITTNNPDATLAVSGGGTMAQLSIWRLVTENYFNSKIQ